MGILNVTPDSFSDGGRYDTLPAALDHAKRLIDEGADWIDVGGESTRPGADPVSVEEEVRRVVPVIAAVSNLGVKVSVDTMKAEVARNSLQAGATMVNDVSALGDPGMAAVCAEAGCEVCLMHMQGEPRSMQAEPRYENVVEDVLGELLAKADKAIQAGVDRHRIWLDPGIGFGKTLSHNLALLHHIGRFVDSGFDVLLGVSRKSFIARVDPSASEPAGRLPGSLAAQVWAQTQGVRMIRVHDVREAKQAALVMSAILEP
ncbi:MAG: Dihydropteroate synthase [Fimbriimonadaceae bacterium]|nr:Dihydropteroate synthase [Fimbriimonadaceae bacterium]